MNNMVDPLSIAQRVFRSLKSRLPDARLMPKGTKNGHQYYAINDRVNGDLLLFRVGQKDNKWNCEITRVDFSRMPSISRVQGAPDEAKKFIEKNNLVGWERTESSGVK